MVAFAKPLLHRHLGWSQICAKSLVRRDLQELLHSAIARRASRFDVARKGVYEVDLAARITLREAPATTPYQLRCVGLLRSKELRFFRGVA